MHDGKVQSVGEADISDFTNSEDDLFGLPCRFYCSTMYTRDGVDLIIHTVQMFHKFSNQSLIPILFPGCTLLLLQWVS